AAATSPPCRSKRFFTNVYTWPTPVNAPLAHPAAVSKPKRRPTDDRPDDPLTEFTMKAARIAGIAMAGGLALAVPFLVSAQGAPASDGPRMQMRGEFHKAHARHGHGARGEHGMSAGAFLRGLDLTEAQRDKVFAVMHAN